MGTNEVLIGWKAAFFQLKGYPHGNVGVQPPLTSQSEVCFRITYGAFLSLTALPEPFLPLLDKLPSVLL